MNASQIMSCAVIGLLNSDARSALPDAPVLATEQRKPRAQNTRLVGFRGRLATVLHRAAWRLEPAPSDRD